MKKSMLAIIFLVGLVIYGGYDYFNKSAKPLTKQGENNLGDIEQSKESKAGEATLSLGVEKGMLAPDFELLDMAGNPVQLSDFRGKTVFVNFWATWCPPCRVEMPHMQQLYENYSDKDVVILGVNVTATEKTFEGVQTFIEKEQLTFPIVLDEEGDITYQYQIMAFPTTYVLDGSGIIKEKFRGAINYEMMEDVLTSIKSQ